MSVVYKFLFSCQAGRKCFFFFVGVAYPFRVLLLSHGIQKWTNFSAMSESFPDPLGVEVRCRWGWLFSLRYFVP